MKQQWESACLSPSPSKPIDFLILSNGPGEITTWVLPVVRELRRQFGENRDLVRISVILAPCPHASGKETAIAQNFPEVDRVQAPEYFWRFLLKGKTPDNWDWYPQGMVIFLGGEQFFALLIAKRLGYATLVYAEWDARWLSWVDYFALGQDLVAQKIPEKYRHKCTVVGDLMADLGDFEQNSTNTEELIGLLPGSKSAKLAQGVPLCLSIVEALSSLRPQARFILPLAPTLTPEMLVSFAKAETNPLVAKLNGISGDLIREDNRYFLQTSGGVRIELLTDFPVFDILSQCRLCLTTVGANTAQLGSLGVPMLVLIPTQQLDAMRAWDGIPGILANLPVLGSNFARLINWFILRQNRLFAWPNIWAKEPIVPELVGELSGSAIASQAVSLLHDPDELLRMRQNLLKVRPQPGAACRLVEIIKGNTLKI